MRMLEIYIDFTDGELEDAEMYVEAAAEAKADGRIAEMNNALKLASEEIAHALSWHDLTASCIEKKRAELKAADIAVPEYMTYIWNEEHDDYIERVSMLKYKIELLKK